MNGKTSHSENLISLLLDDNSEDDHAKPGLLNVHYTVSISKSKHRSTKIFITESLFINPNTGIGCEQKNSLNGSAYKNSENLDLLITKSKYVHKRKIMNLLIIESRHVHKRKILNLPNY